MKLLPSVFTILIAVCYARRTCVEKLADDFKQIAAFTYSEKMNIEEQIKIMMTADANCKIGRFTRVSFYEEIKECAGQIETVEEAKKNATKQEEKWCDLRGKSNGIFFFIFKFNIFPDTYLKNKLQRPCYYEVRKLGMVSNEPKPQLGEKGDSKEISRSHASHINCQ